MQNRFNNPIQIAKKYINDNKFGKIINITTRVRGLEIKNIMTKHYGEVPGNMMEVL